MFQLDVYKRQAPESPLAYVALLALSREASADEIKVLEEFLSEQQSRYAVPGESLDVASRKALADLCHMLLASNEFVYVD